MSSTSKFITKSPLPTRAGFLISLETASCTPSRLLWRCPCLEEMDKSPEVGGGGGREVPFTPAGLGGWGGGIGPSHSGWVSTQFPLGNTEKSEHLKEKEASERLFKRIDHNSTVSAENIRGVGETGNSSLAEGTLSLGGNPRLSHS